MTTLVAAPLRSGLVWPIPTVDNTRGAPTLVRYFATISSCTLFVIVLV